MGYLDLWPIKYQLSFSIFFDKLKRYKIKNHMECTELLKEVLQPVRVGGGEEIIFPTTCGIKNSFIFKILLVELFEVVLTSSMIQVDFDFVILEYCRLLFMFIINACPFISHLD